MGVEMPTAGRELLPSWVARAVSRPGEATGSWWVPRLLLVAAGVAGPAVVVAGAGAPGAGVPWVLAALGGVVAWSRVGQRAQGRLRGAALVMAAAAVVVAGGHSLWAWETRSLGAGVPTGPYVLVASSILVALGAGIALGWRGRRGWDGGVAADALLLLLVAAVGLLRWVVEPLERAAAPAFLPLATLATLQSLAAAPVLMTLLMAMRRRVVVPPRSAGLLLASSLLLACAAFLFLGGFDRRPLVQGDAFDLVSLGGWILFGAAGMAARTPAATARAMLDGRRTRDALRKLLVPGAAVFLAAVVVDIAAGGMPSAATVAAVAALGAVLALRTAQAFSLADRSAEERRQLAHTQALVEVTHALAGTTDLDDTLRVISESARAVLGTRGAGIELLTEDGQELVTRAAVGLPDDVLGLRFPVEGSFTGWVVRHGEPRASIDPSKDPYIQPQSLVFLGRWPVAAAPIRFRDETLGALFACIRAEPFEPEELHLMGALAEQAAIAIHNARLFEQVVVLSITDPLTGLANRRQLERELAREFAAAGRGRNLVAVIFDLDDFKDYNDAHGHLAGDEALQAFARTLAAETRAMNFAARYGGDEFVVLLGGADAEGAHAFVQRIRPRFREACLALGRGQITVSAGLAAWAPEMERPDELLRRADDELYRAKARSRT